MVHQTNISFDSEVWYNEKLQELKKNRKLSRTINSLLKNHLEIKEDKEQQDLVKLERELEEVSAKKVLLMKKKEAIQQKEKEEKNRYLVIE